MNPKVELRQSRDFGQIISDTIVFIIQNWKSLLKNYIVFCGVFMAGNILFSVLLQLRVVNIHKEIAGESGSSGPISIFGSEYYLVLLFSYLNIVAVVTSTFSYITLYQLNDNTPPTIEAVWAYFKYYFFRVAWSLLLLFVICFIGLFFCVLPGILIGYLATNSVVTGIVTFFCVLIPMCYFITVFFLFYPIMLIENRGFGYSFSKCFALIKGKWWSTFGVVVVIAIITYALYLLVLIPFSVASGGSITFLSYNVSTVVTICYCVAIGLLQVINILHLTGAGVSYFSYMEDKESVGLLERIDTLGTTPTEEDAGSANDEY